MRLLLVLGVLGGATLLFYAFGLPQCAPVTGDSEVFCNRFWTPALIGIAAGFVGLRRWASMVRSAKLRTGLSVLLAGSALMAFGNGAEYWLFTSWPHDGPDGWLRGMLWMSFLLGWLLVLVGATWSGALLLWRSNPMPARLLGSVVITTISLTVFLGLFAVALLAIGSSLYALVAAERSQRATATA